MKKITSKLVAIMACAVVGCGAMVSNAPIVSNYSSDLSAKAVLVDNSNLIKLTSTSDSNFDKRVVQIYAVYSDGSSYYSTGFIVGKHTVATCAHGLYKSDKNGYPTYVNVYVERCGSSSYNNDYSFKVTYSADKKNILVKDEYKKTANRADDIGIITTTKDLSALGKFDLNTAYTPDKNNPHTYTVKGYPMEDGYSEYHRYQCYSSGNYRSIINGGLRYYASTLHGMSGSPVIYNGKVISINVSGIETPSSKYNIGVEDISWLNDYIS